MYFVLFGFTVDKLHDKNLKFELSIIGEQPKVVKSNSSQDSRKVYRGKRIFKRAYSGMGLFERQERICERADIKSCDNINCYS